MSIAVYFLIFTLLQSEGGKTFLLLADNIDLIAGSNDKLKDLTSRLTLTHSFCIEVRIETSKDMFTTRKVKHTVGLQPEITVKWRKDAG